MRVLIPEEAPKIKKKYIYIKCYLTTAKKKIKSCLIYNYKTLILTNSYFYINFKVNKGLIIKYCQII